MVIVVMGPAGAGKTTIGQALARALGFASVDADDFHSAASVARMRAGVPLDEADRAPWLHTLRGAIDAWLAAGSDVVLACSALRASHRAALGTRRPGVRLVYLHGAPALLAARLASRRGHFARATLLPSQLHALEPPARGEAISVDVAAPPERIVGRVVSALGVRPRHAPRG